MKEKLDQIINELKELRDTAFRLQNQELHQQLGRAMANLIRARDLK